MTTNRQIVADDMTWEIVGRSAASKKYATT